MGLRRRSQSFTQNFPTQNNKCRKIIPPSNSSKPLSIVRDILSGKGNPGIQNIVPETEEDDDEKGKPRVVKDAIKRIKNKKKKQREKQDGN